VRLTFFVPGQPVPQGSKSAFVSKKTGKPVVVDKDVRLPQWRMKITAYALDAIANSPAKAGYFPIEDPIGAQITFFMPRPASHYLPVNSKRSRPELKSNAPDWVAQMPDIDKLLRAVFDALTDGQVWRDDGQVVFTTMTKRYADERRGPGVEITVGPMITPLRSNP
jgi:Holliday junction resolvase RusA-like endonuclease